MFKKAYDGGYAIGAFNINNMEIVQGITEACRRRGASDASGVKRGASALMLAILVSDSLRQRL